MCSREGACICGADASAAACVEGSTTPACLDATGMFALETTATAASTCKVQNYSMCQHIHINILLISKYNSLSGI